MMFFLSGILHEYNLLQDDRCKLLKHLGEKRQELQQLQTELERYRECDPEVLKQMAVEGDIAKEATNRWTGRS